MAEAKQGLKIDFGGAIEAVSARPKIERGMTNAAIEDAKIAGFAGRADGVKIDRRTLRKSARTEQLNMKLRPEVRDEFHRAALGFDTVEAFIEHLLELHRNSK
ncbi:hypothetical protein [Acidiphilium iwatense]|uniref:Uncharacterized protein n=1 Tax=Acidiphilium iwatense TaxID=768198 RepID=A0ABS9E3V7_9PROT|nr:hypothetical protein [Acidiphilium iwatense]MCF3948269.1 hypothetical protein [Acidiphilium iwatense]